MLKVGIIGATGYVGAELLRLLLNHPNVEVTAISSVSFEGQEISDVYPGFFNITKLICTTKEEVVDKCDLVFLALPHGLSEEIAILASSQNKIVIDMGADFRLEDKDIYEKWYGKKFINEELHKKSVYGLAELNREKIKKSKIIANPGCYPTSIALGLMPLLKNKMIDTKNIICDSKSGATGAGRGLSLKTHFVELNENFAPYSIGNHRHTPEIEQTLSQIGGEDVSVIFTPHLLPINRGILSTIYCSLKEDQSKEEIHKLYTDFYENEKFVNVLDINKVASIKEVKTTNNCNISIHKNEDTKSLIIVSTIDNMIKGAAGAAIQNMNIIMGLEENTGLNLININF